jgi:hypothetical protein
MKVKDIKLFAIVGGSAAVTAAALGVAVLQGPVSGSVAGDMQTGATVTQSAAPDTVAPESAAPEITGPAPLPTEEQGLPG